MKNHNIIMNEPSKEKDVVIINVCICCLSRTFRRRTLPGAYMVSTHAVNTANKKTSKRL